MKSNLNRAYPIALSENIEASPSDLVRVVKEFGFEGIVAKRTDSLYESGKRSGSWIKYKVNRGQEFVIGGYTPGNALDAVIVGYYEDAKLMYAAKVRNGFVPRVRREVFERLRDLETDTCPFANLPEKKRTQWALTKEEMKNCRWLRPELVAQIEFTEWTPDGHLRHSTFVGLRVQTHKRYVDLQENDIAKVFGTARVSKIATRIVVRKRKSPRLFYKSLKIAYGDWVSG